MTSQPQRPAATTTTEPGPLEWILLAGGDVLMDRSEAAGRDPFSQLVPPLTAADLAVVNVEMAVSERGGAAEKEFTFRAPPSAALTMARAGVDVGALGNNHAADFGTEALVDTIEYLRGAGVAPVGAGRDADEAFTPATVTVGGDRQGVGTVSVAVLGASGVVPRGFAAGPARPGVASAYERDRLIAAVREAAATHDAVVVAIHWGTEGAPCPAGAQVALGDDLVAAGAAVVLGSHPHVLQPVVERGGGVIAYSLGNFVWHARSGPQGETGILEVRFVDGEVTGTTFHPHQLDGRGDPVPAGDSATRRIEAAVSDHCA
jgi:poly-gamma-glutamate synthesis protein (capsule biosynthesis protein)